MWPTSDEVTLLNTSEVIKTFLSVGVGKTFEAGCLFVCLFVRSITQITNDPKVFKLGVGNDLGISCFYSRAAV